MEALAPVLSAVQTAFIFLIVLTVLVAVHELGHYLFARWYGMHVESFAVFMGGVRKTSLSERLPQPLAPAYNLVIAGFLALGLVIFGANVPQLFLTGLLVLAILLPVWIANRLRILYHMPHGKVWKVMLLSWAGAFVLLAFGTRFQGISAGYVLTLLLFASIIGLLIIYYAPLQNKADEAKMGEGKLEIGGEEVPVQFRPILSRKNREGTEFSLLLLPLGGFAAIKGMHPREDGSETKIDQGFFSKSPFARLMVLFAGPLFSILFGVLIFAGILAFHGQEEPTNEPVLGQVVEGPAQESGLQAGDRVAQIDGQPIDTWFALVSTVREQPNTTLVFTIDRDGERFDVPVTPIATERPEPLMDEDFQPTEVMAIQGRIGASPAFNLVRISPVQAAGQAFVMPFVFVREIGASLARGGARETFGGPATIAQVTGEVSRDRGIIGVLQLAAFLSVSLGIMNLLPIVPLDGGQMVVAFLEMLRGGKRLSLRIQNSMATVGMFLVLLLMVSVISLDLGRNTSPPPGDGPPPIDSEP